MRLTVALPFVPPDSVPRGTDRGKEKQPRRRLSAAGRTQEIGGIDKIGVDELLHLDMNGTHISDESLLIISVANELTGAFELGSEMQ